MTTIQAANLHAESRLQHMMHASFRGGSREDVTYAVITEFLLQYKHPVERFVLYPQLSLRWKPKDPKDTRAEVPDIGVGNFSLQAPCFKMRLGVEAKRLVGAMENLPEPIAIQDHEDVLSAFHTLFYQGEDQAKAAIKGGHTLSKAIPYLLFVGPYFTPVKFGPFSPQQLGVRTHKPSDSADYKETLKAASRLASPPTPRKLYLLGTNDSTTQLNNIISSTDALAQPLIQEAATYKCMLASLVQIIRSKDFIHSVECKEQYRMRCNRYWQHSITQSTASYHALSHHMLPASYRLSGCHLLLATGLYFPVRILTVVSLVRYVEFT
jgi:hypothetical protein